MEKEFVITNNEREEIITFLKRGAYSSGRNMLNQLKSIEESEYVKTLKDKIKELESKLKKEVKNGDI